MAVDSPGEGDFGLITSLRSHSSALELFSTCSSQWSQSTVPFPPLVIESVSQYCRLYILASSYTWSYPATYSPPSAFTGYSCSGPAGLTRQYGWKCRCFVSLLERRSNFLAEETPLSTGSGSEGNWTTAAAWRRKKDLTNRSSCNSTLVPPFPRSMSTPACGSMPLAAPPFAGACARALTKVFSNAGVLISMVWWARTCVAGLFGGGALPSLSPSSSLSLLLGLHVSLVYFTLVLFRLHLFSHFEAHLLAVWLVYHIPCLTPAPMTLPFLRLPAGPLP